LGQPDAVKVRKVGRAGASLLLIMAIFGFVHLRRVAPETEILPKVATRAPVSSS
jgi:hypothetical protein